MKKFLDHIKEENTNEVKIIEISYFDFVDLHNIYEPSNFKDNYNNTIEKIIERVKNSPDIFSKVSNKYHFLAAIKDKSLCGVFYKQLKGDSNIYDDGYIITEKYFSKLLMEMKTIGSFTTFSNFSNLYSIKNLLNFKAEILYITDSTPIKSGYYNKDITNQTLKQLLINEKIYYKSGDEKFFILNESGIPNIKGLKNFIINNNNIELKTPKKISGDSLKIYFYHKKI